jgi:hypothetical protein
MDARYSMLTTPAMSFCERKTPAQAAQSTQSAQSQTANWGPRPLSKFTSAVLASCPDYKIDQLKLVDLYFQLSESTDLDFVEIREALDYVRVTYSCSESYLGWEFPRAVTDDFGNDPVPSFVLADNSLCLGGLHHVNPSLLGKLGVRAVLSCGATEFCDMLRQKCPEIEVMTLSNLNDDGLQSAYPYFLAGTEFIRVKRAENKTVLVHCHRGVSRSPTLVMAFLIREFGLSAEHARQAVRRVRPRVWPTTRLEQDLLFWEHECHQKRLTLSLSC